MSLALGMAVAEQASELVGLLRQHLSHARPRLPGSALAAVLLACSAACELSPLVSLARTRSWSGLPPEENSGVPRDPPSVQRGGKRPSTASSEEVSLVDGEPERGEVDTLAQVQVSVPRDDADRDVSLDCSGSPDPRRDLVVPLGKNRRHEVVAIRETEHGVARARVGPYCVEELQVERGGGKRYTTLRVVGQARSWRLDRLRQGLDKVAEKSIRAQLALLSATDFLFDPGYQWTYTTLRAFHGIPEPEIDPSATVVATVEEVASLGATDIAYVRYTEPSPIYEGHGEVWIRRGHKLWWSEVYGAPNLSPASWETASEWLPQIGSKPHFDGAAPREELACGASVCLPAWISTPGPYESLGILPGIAPLRIVTRGYSEETGDGATFHHLLQSVVQGASFRPRSLRPRPEPPDLQAVREAAKEALASGDVDRLRDYASAGFVVSPADEPQEAWVEIEEWRAHERTSAVAAMRRLLSHPCVLVTEIEALCVDPPTTSESFREASVIGSVASLTFRKERAGWRLGSYVDSRQIAR